MFSTTMISVFKDLFIPSKDYAGRPVDQVISDLAANTGTDAYTWSYLEEQSVYEDTINGLRVYPHEVAKYAS